MLQKIKLQNFIRLDKQQNNNGAVITNTPSDPPLHEKKEYLFPYCKEYLSNGHLFSLV